MSGGSFYQETAMGTQVKVTQIGLDVYRKFDATTRFELHEVENHTADGLIWRLSHSISR